MTDILDLHWSVSDDAVANQVGDETVILHMGNGTYYGLDTIGTFLWEGLKSGSSPSETVKQITAEYDVDASTVETDLRRFLAELEEQGLVTKS
ncbi:MAG: PqqD family protein [Hyphomicrobiales bacterium]|nr:PqqD family protein [Hyphomicrobiales bacterium]